MKKSLTLLALVVFAAGANAQGVLKQLGDRAKEKTSNRVDNKVDQKMDEALDKIFERKRPKKKEIASDADTASTSQSSGGAYARIQGKLMKGVFGSSSCSAKPTYAFQHNYLMEVVTTEKKGKSKETMKIRMYTSATIGQLAYTIEESSESPQAEGTTVVMDGQDSTMVMLMHMEGTKTGFCSNTSYQEAETVSQEEQQKQLEDFASGWTKTGNTRTILGKLCYEHVQNSDGIEQTVWVADGSSSMAEVIRSMKSTPGVSMPSQLNAPFGLIMEMSTKDTKSGETMVMKMLEINENQQETISTNGYSFF